MSAHEFSSPFQIQKKILSVLNEEAGQQWYNSPYSVQLQILKELQNGGVVKEAPEDGKMYVRSNGGWIELPTSFEAVVVDELPEASADTMGKMYLLRQTDPETEEEYCDEYITISEDGEAEGETVYKWEQIGETRIDLTDYYTKEETEGLFDETEEVGANAFAALNKKVDDNNEVVGSILPAAKNYADTKDGLVRRDYEKAVEETEKLSAAGIYYSVKSYDDTIKNCISITQADYDDLAEKDPKTLYVIVG